MSLKDFKFIMSQNNAIIFSHKLLPLPMNVIPTPSRVQTKNLKVKFAIPSDCHRPLSNLYLVPVYYTNVMTLLFTSSFPVQVFPRL